MTVSKGFVRITKETSVFYSKALYQFSLGTEENNGKPYRIPRISRTEAGIPKNYTDVWS
jgi:hypothetical protein